MLDNLFGKFFKFCLAIFVVIDFFSFLSYQNSFWQLTLFISLSLLVLIVSWYKLEYGVYFLLAELFVGSQGHLFALTTPYFVFSIRMSLFGAVFLVWLVKLLIGQRAEFFSKANHFLSVYLLLFIFLALASLRGLLANQIDQVFFDANGWLFLAIAPVVFSIFKSTNEVKKVFSILLAAGCFIAAKTVLVLILFAYPWPIDIAKIYTWLRDARIGEITYVSGSYYRVFFQSQIYVLIALLISFSFILFKDKLSLSLVTVKWLRAVCLLSSTAVIACLSRSYWVGATFSLVAILFALLIKFGYSFKKIARLLLVVILTVVLEIGFLFVITGDLTHNLTQDNWIKGRLISPAAESAGLSRLAQLGPLGQKISENWLLGAGFGKTVTYQTNDPRILKQNPSGIYTTYAFEWGYLDIWLKTGLIGLVVYLFLYYSVFKEGVFLIFQGAGEWPYLISALLIGLIGLMVTSVFSPYLNHPLGIGYLVLISAIIYYFKNKYVESKSKISH